jgi:hypothetical protein
MKTGDCRLEAGARPFESLAIRAAKKAAVKDPAKLRFRHKR